MPLAPVRAGAICLIIELLLCLSPIPFSWIFAVPFALAVLVISIICMAREKIASGVMLLLGSFIGAPICYLISWPFMLLLGRAAAN